METSSAEFNAQQKSLIRELSRRRVFMFFWAFVVVAIGNTITEESDILLHVIDDYVDIILAVAALAIFVLMWKKQSTSQLRKANNIATILAVLGLVATIFAITQEINDPTDFGNEIPTLFFMIFMIINRFL